MFEFRFTASWQWIACQDLEQNGKLRCCRFVNDKDLICYMPMIKFKHVGMMIKMPRDCNDEVIVTYPKLVENWEDWWNRVWMMSWLAGLNMVRKLFDYSIIQK